MAKLVHLLLLVGLVLTVTRLPSARAETPLEDDMRPDDAEEDDYADTERAQLILRKSIKEEYGVQGRNVTVVLELFNAGNSPATDVVLRDAALPEGVELLSGSLVARFDKINVGGQETLTYTVVPRKGDFALYLGQAKVTYKAEAEGNEKQLGKSYKTGVYVLTQLQRATRFALIAGRWGTLGMAKSTADWRNLAATLGFIGLLLGANSAFKWATTARSSRARKKALASLEKEE